MCDFFGWEKDDEEKATAREGFRDAVTKQFNSEYGTDENDISAWWNLCRVLEIVPIPEDLYACRDVVRSTHVNLIDLVDLRRTGQTVQVFDSEEALSIYTIGEGKFFPKENAYAGGLLRFLLRKILNPPPANSPAAIRPRRKGKGRARSGR